MHQPLVRILGMDGSGKSTICRLLESLDPQIVAFDGTPKFAFRWLQTYGIDQSEELTPEQMDIRQRIFMKMNEQEAYLHNSICEERPVVATRGRADTWISANALRDVPMPRDLETLFPEDLRPDLLVILTADLKDIEARIDARGERKTGANSMEYHIRTHKMYRELADIAHPHISVLTYDTSKESVTPDSIAAEVLSTMRNLTNVAPRNSVMTPRDMKSAAGTLAKKYELEDFPQPLQKRVHRPNLKLWNTSTRETK